MKKRLKLWLLDWVYWNFAHPIHRSWKQKVATADQLKCEKTWLEFDIRVATQRGRLRS